MKPLESTDIQNFLSQNPQWDFSEGHLERTFQFPNFARAMVFVNKIINPIEEFQSYPRIKITYNRVTVSLLDHTRGYLTLNELKMAEEFEKLK